MRFALFVFMLFLSAAGFAQQVDAVLSQARTQKGPLLDTLKELVSIESGSRDLEGLERIAQLIAGRLKSLGGEVELVEPADVYKMEDTPERIGRMVRGTFKGSGAKRILLIAHMDTVYPRGLLVKQPFRVDGERAYGLGIADCKQGIAVILHAVAMLRALDSRDYGTLTVLINADEELSSPGSRSLLTRLGAEHDATLSFEASRAESDKIALATAGIASIALKVYGKASHAGAAMAKHAQAIYKELRQELLADALAEGGGTDAAFAALKTKNAVVERFGPRGFGAHSTDDEYVLVSSIEPRLYLAARLIMDIAHDRVR
jgi:glutamate carboxypeptidase